MTNDKYDKAHFRFDRQFGRWSLHVPVVEGEEFDTHDNGRDTHVGKPMRVQNVNIATGWDGDIRVTFTGPNIKQGGDLGAYNLGHWTTLQEVKDRCPQTWDLIRQDAEDLIAAMKDDHAHAIAGVASIDGVLALKDYS